MLGHAVIGALALAITASACVPPQAQLIPPQRVRVDASYQCNDTAGYQGADRCVFWRTIDGKTYFGPFSMVRLPPAGTDTIIPPPLS